MEKVKTWFKAKWQIVVDEMTSDSPAKKVQNVLYMILGSFIFAIADGFFLIPMKIVSGGVASLSVIFNSIPGLDVIPVDYYVFIFTWGFFIVGLIFVGLRYSLNTLIVTICYPLFILLFSFLIDVAVIDGVHFLDITQLTVPIQISNGVIPAESLKPLSYLVAAVIGGLLIGTGIGFCYSGGGSSGGVDVINLLVHKFFHIKIGTSTFICDALIILGGFAVNGYNLLASLVGVLCAFICSKMLDSVFLGNSQYYMALVISEDWEKLNDYINDKLGRGTTLIHTKGGYTKEDMVMLDICFDKEDYHLITDLIRAVDPNAFVTIIRTDEILGYGFSRDTPKAKENSVNPEDARKLIAQLERKRRKTFNEK